MKFTLGLLLGAAAGAAVVHYLNSAEGRALVDKIKGDVDEVSENISNAADTIVSKTKSFMGKTEEEEPAVETIERIVVVGLNEV
ncbi:MAG: hypothetical protein JWQ78_842 [Sediminibacterium sp.]|nr:hypothetical protein [Sediminibacterium sp.]